MLPYRRHGRNAFQQDPEKEARLLCFASASTPSSGGTPDPAKRKTPEEEKEELINELEARIKAKGGKAILGEYKDKDEAYNVALRVLELAKKAEPTDVFEGGVTAEQVLRDNTKFGTVVMRRLRYGELIDPTKKRIENTREDIGDKAKDTVDGKTTPAAQTVDATADATKDAVKDVIDATPERPSPAKEALEAAVSVKKKLETIMVLLDSIPDSTKIGGKKLVDTEMEEEVKNQYNKLLVDIADLEIFAEWESGAMPASKFAYTASERWYGEQASDSEAEKKDKEAKTAALDTLISGTKGATDADISAGKLPDLTDDMKWGTYTPNLHQRVQDKMEEIVPSKKKIIEIRDRVILMSEIIDTTEVEALLRKVRQEYLANTPKEEVAANPGLMSMWASVNNRLGIQWLSIADMMDIVTRVKNSILEVRKQKLQLRRARGASYLGKIASMVPGYEEVEHILDATNEKENSDVRKGYKEYLTSPAVDIGFDGMFGPNGVLHKHKHDSNRATAILEVAAEKGMLYDINSYDKVDEAMVLKRWPLRDYFPKEWNDTQCQTYFEGLQYTTLQGRKKMAGVAEPFKVYTDGYKSLQGIDGLLKSRNLWLTKGYIEMVLSKGKAGEMSALIANTILNRMQADPWLRSITPEDWYESVGGLGAKNVAFGLGYLKWEKSKLTKWAQENDGIPNASLDGAGEYATLREKIRRDVLAKDPTVATAMSEKNKDLPLIDELVPRILASQAVELPNGKIITIFSPEYASYNYNNGPGKQKEMKVADSDNDFYKEQSEAMMSDPTTVALILRANYSGNFENTDQAQFFVASVVKSVKDLDAYAEAASDPKEKMNLQQAAEYFRNTMGQKLQQWLQGEIQKDAIAEQRLKNGKDYALLALFNAGMLKVSFLEEQITTKSPAGSRLAVALLRQCATEDQSSAKVKQEALAAQRRLEALKKQNAASDGPAASGSTRPDPTLAP